MKSNSNDRPPILQDLGNGSWHYNYNITEVEIQPEPMAEQEGEQAPAARKAYDYDTVEVWGRPDYDKCVKAVLRSRRDETEEFSLINKYNAFCAWAIDGRNGQNGIRSLPFRSHRGKGYGSGRFAESRNKVTGSKL